MKKTFKLMIGSYSSTVKLFDRTPIVVVWSHFVETNYLQSTPLYCWQQKSLAVVNYSLQIHYRISNTIKC